MSDSDKKALRGDVVETQVIRDHTPPGGSGADDGDWEGINLDADEYILGVGTAVEQSIRWPNRLPLAAWFKHTDEHLRRMRNFFNQHQARKNNVCMIDGTWLVWCYASIDIKNLYMQIGVLNDRISALEEQIEALTARLDGGSFMIGGR